MKKLLVSIGLLLMVGAAPVFADAPTCDDYKQFAKVIRMATDYISETKGDFSENEQLENDMDELVSVLGVVAETEKDEGFSSAVANMAKVWEKKSWSGDDVKSFKQAFDATSVAIDRVAAKHCK